MSRWLLTLTILVSLFASTGCVHRRIACRRAMRMCCPAPAACVPAAYAPAESIHYSSP